ncbi:MAG: glycosyltransferase family 9 protein [Planctomycetes bacterium]|nr:glycosyltransferase family 9 protein [Planctomycetota bacterium]
MQVVAVRKSITVPVEKGHNTITLRAGVRYVMHDTEVDSGVAAGVWKRVEPLPEAPARFNPRQTCTGQLLVPFIGGLGEAISTLPVLASIRRQHPELTLDVTTTPGPAELFAMSGQLHSVRTYPLRLEAWRRYEHYLTMEGVHETGQQPGRPQPEVFAAALGIELTDRTFQLKLPEAADEVDADDSATPVVGLAVGEGESLRAYPAPLLRELVSLLVGHGIGCVLLGRLDPAWVLPESPPMITDLRGKTKTLLDLAVWLRAMTVVVAHDSMILHLAAALGRPTIALFGPTSRDHASLHPRTTSLASAAPCAPCHEAGQRCPKGYDRCIAWDDDAVRPQTVADAVLERVSQHRAAAPTSLAAAK